MLFKAADWTQMILWMQVNDLLKKYIDLIHGIKNYLESGKRDPKQLLHLLSTTEADHVSTFINKTASDTLKQQLESNNCSWALLLQNVSLILIAQDWNGI